jgi:hypothetical protein
MKYGFLIKNLFICINNSTFHFWNVFFWYNYLSLIKSLKKLIKKNCAIWLVQDNVLSYNVYGLLF